VTVPQQGDTGRYLPIRYPEEQPYWEAARDGRLVLPRCDNCEWFWYPVGPVCPRCLSDRYSWMEPAGDGVVSSYVIYHKAWAPWLADRVPYAVVQVELPEGPRLTTNLIGVEPSEVRIGMPVRVCFEPITEEVTLVQFQPR
jgi:uncharacterized protein